MGKTEFLKYSDKKKSVLQINRINLLIVITLWTGIIVASIIWNLSITRKSLMDIVEAEAMIAYTKDIMYRRWNTMHGGVYVDTTSYTQPNPYLDIENRDIITEDGRFLTLINPAYMTRQVYEVTDDSLGLSAHLTSLNPIRPQNAPDEWEAEGLARFEAGAEKYSEIVEKEGSKFLRYMKPFVTEKGCLKCHAKQGYKVGDIRGGLSVTLPVSQHFEAQNSQIFGLIIGHVLIWFAGFVLINIGYRRLDGSIHNLKKSREQMSAIVENSPNPIIISSCEDYSVVFFNKKADDIFGFDEHENEIFLPDLFYNPGDKPKVENLVEDNNEFENYEMQFKKPDGSRIWVLISGLKMDFDDNEVLFIIFNDITYRKEIEKELISARYSAEAANLAKNEFLANMSHELRTPLNGIMGYAQIIKNDKDLSEQKRRGGEIIYKSGNHLLNLINDILDISKIEAHKLELNEKTFKLGDVLENITHISRIRAEQKGLEFHFEKLSPFPSKVYGDEKKLSQIILNLIGNAIKFTNKGHVILRVGYSDEARLKIEVEDTGVGISEDKLEQIFIPFQQVNDIIKKPEGAGLGLAITRNLVYLMGGDILVESEAGKGSLFKLFIEVPDASILQSTGPGTIAGRSEIDLEPRVLIVAERWDIRSELKTVLSKRGEPVSEAISLKDAENKAETHKPELIIFSLENPDTLLRLNELEIFDDIPKLCFAEENNLIKYIEKGIFDSVLPLPVNEQMLSDKINEFLPTGSKVKLETEKKEDKTDYVLPDKEKLRELYEMAIIGDIRAIQNFIKDLEKNNPECRKFALQLKNYASDFSVDEIMGFIGKYI